MSTDDTTETEARAVARALFADDDTPEADVRATSHALFGGPATTTTDDAHEDSDGAREDVRAIFQP